MFGWIGRALRAAVSEAANLFNDLRIRGWALWGWGIFVDFLPSLIGVRPMKKLRVRVVILREEAVPAHPLGKLLLGSGTTDDVVPGPVVSPESEAQPAIQLADAILRKEAKVRLVAAAGEPIIARGPGPAPTAALDVSCEWGAWAEDFGGAGKYFRSASAELFGALPVGYAAPVTVFVVRKMVAKTGCSLGPLTNYVTVTADAMKFQPRVLAHELGHSGGLMWHSGAANNLMEQAASGDRLNRWQAALFRTSPHVTYL